MEILIVILSIVLIASLAILLVFINNGIKALIKEIRELKENYLRISERGSTLKVINDTEWVKEILDRIVIKLETEDK